MNSDADSLTSEDQEFIEQLRASQTTFTDIQIDPRTEFRMRQAVMHRIDERSRIAHWLFRPLWRPMLAAFLPFATGLAFGHSDYLIDAPLHLEPEQSIPLVTGIDAADSLIEYFETDVRDETDGELEYVE